MMLLGVAAVVMQLPTMAGGNLNLARRITGHTQGSSGQVHYSAGAWDPDSKESRQYLGPLDCDPSPLFTYNKKLPDVITKPEEMEALVFAMHYNLEPSRTVMIEASCPELTSWVEKLNTLWYLRCFTEDAEDGKTTVRVYYNTDARVLAAFRNPGLKTELTERERELLNVCADWIVENIQPGMPNLLKFYKVHDALVDGCHYDINYYTTADIILDGRGRCMSYTSATQLLLHMMRMDCRPVLGVAEMNHIWNIIDINGDWYHSDVTWDDPISSDGKDVKRYDYLLMTDKEISLDHTWIGGHNYSKTPPLNKVNIFKRQLVRANEQEQDDDAELTNPTDKESIFDGVEAYWSELVANKGVEVADKAAPVVAPVAKPVEQVAGKVTERIQKRTGALAPAQNQRPEDEYVDVNNIDDLNHNLKVSAKKMDTGTLEFKLGGGSESAAKELMKASFHFYLKQWNFLYQQKNNTLELDVKHWPHVRILSAIENPENEKALEPEEKKALEQCRKIAREYGAVWKLERQKLRDVYKHLIDIIKYEPGESDIVKLFKDKESGSAGYSEALSVILTLLDIPNITVHGRSHTNVHVWNMVRRASGKWYHLSAAQDDAEHHHSEHQFEYFQSCDDEVHDSLVWDKDETFKTPVKNKRNAHAKGLLGPSDEPKYAPEVKEKKLRPRF